MMTVSDNAFVCGCDKEPGCAADGAGDVSNKIRIVFETEVCEDWFDFIARLARVIPLAVTSKPFLLYVPDEFLEGNRSIYALAYRRLMEEVDSALTPEEHELLVRMQRELHNL